MKFLALWGPVIIVMALIFHESSLSDPGAPPGNISDKTAHGIAYAGLGAALIRALAGGRSARMSAARILFAAFITTAYGASDEFHQSFVPNRTPDVLDLAADACGGLIGAVALAVLARLASRFALIRRSG